MAAEHWFRWHHGTVTDPKWRIVAKRASHVMSRNVTVGHVVAVWSAMLENASQANPRGSLVGWCDEDIAVAFDLDEAEVAAIREAMQEKTLDGNDLIAWNRRQIKQEDAKAADRKKRQREREKSQIGNVTKVDVTECHGVSRDVTRETETETETDKSKSNIAHRSAERMFEDQFWPAYPRKVGKENALKSFVKLRPDDDMLAVMLKALTAQAASEQWRKDKQFIPHPATWINGKRWQDEADAGGNYPSESTPSYMVGAL